ncbi:MAG: NADH-quinone oxidoreductase subunit J [Alteraurantiacibacter sp.]
MIQLLAFYLFAVLTCVSGAFVVLSRNPVHSVLWLILAFFNAAGLMVLVGAEFIAMLLVIVYVGAVAVLFLFVVMMLNIDFAELRAGFIKNAPLGALVAVVLFVELLVVVILGQAGPVQLGTPDGTSAPLLGEGNIENIGALLYSRYLYLFELAGIVLLVALIGAVVLTHRTSRAVRAHQNIAKQNARRPQDATELKSPEVGKGVEL